MNELTTKLIVTAAGGVIVGTLLGVGIVLYTMEWFKKNSGDGLYNRK